MLAHIASDGPAAWTIETPTRDYVLQQMVKAIERWDLNAERNINYRSFEPILGLLRCYETPECQHWAVWALANLTKVRCTLFDYLPFARCCHYQSVSQVYPQKYSHLVDEEHGMELLVDLLNHPMPYEHIKSLAQMVVDNVGSPHRQAVEPMDG